MPVITFICAETGPAVRQQVLCQSEPDGLLGWRFFYRSMITRELPSNVDTLSIIKTELKQGLLDSLELWFRFLYMICPI